MEFAVAHAQERIDANESKTKATVLQLESQRQQIEAERGALSKEIESVRLEKEHLVERLKAQEVSIQRCVFWFK
jgi:chromosome segregation ATPase